MNQSFQERVRHFQMRMREVRARLLDDRHKAPRENAAASPHSALMFTPATGKLSIVSISNARLSDENERLRAARQWFSNMCEGREALHDGERTTITYGELRKARAALDDNWGPNQG